MRTVVAFAAAPLGAIVVFSGTLLSTVVNNESWAGFADALFGFGAIVYLVYCVGLVLILPIVLALKRKGLLTRLVMVGYGWSGSFIWPAGWPSILGRWLGVGSLGTWNGRSLRVSAGTSPAQSISRYRVAYGAFSFLAAGVLHHP